ncbi:cyclin-A2-4 [Ricinus communis]|uniref:cyclin-A2-4 n=1 Tax=Ricinus communis TaxID=3988 RepID=UPI0007721D02|nr:cyclin-A2-4 [Ricinus communis]XP_015573778.1 cyclin-A2-4 [Ricinus communis]XP_015573779.1 cyclin-A2-4 [Ricinus communis]|eukprot:XP_015573777.1 cyclin-A2-4 [Ricinus communis]
MKKENMIPVNMGDHNARITRARAAALRASSKVLPLRETRQQGQKRILRANSKRAALDENNTSAIDNAKRRAVLRDVTNVCCESSYRSCFSAAKIQAKNGKQAKKGQLNVSKVIPSRAAEPPRLQADSKIKVLQDSIKTEPKSEVISSTTLEKDEHCQLNKVREFGTSNHWVPKPCSRVPSQLCSPANQLEKQSLIGGGMISSNPDVKDIDCDHKDPQLCSSYASDIYSNLRVAELVRRTQSTYMETIQRDITQSMRGILIDWLVEVSEEYKLVADTLYLTVYLIDWFLSQNYIERQRLQLLGITCMLIASKYEEICAPRVEEFCFITDNTYTQGEVLKMESLALKYFGFQLFAPTAKTFLRRFLRAAQASYKSPSYELEYLADYLAELTLVDYSFLNFLPSVIAASAVFLARWTLDQTSHPWNPTLEHYTSYKALDIKTTVVALQDLQLNTNVCPLNAIRMKYRQQKYKSVAALSSPRLLETLF